MLRGLDYVTPTFRLVRFMVEKTDTSSVGCVLEEDSGGSLGISDIGAPKRTLP